MVKDFIEENIRAYSHEINQLLETKSRWWILSLLHFIIHKQNALKPSINPILAID